MLGAVANWIVRRAEAYKAQRSPRKWGEASIQPWEGAGLHGAKRRPTNQAALVARFSGWVYACAMLNASAISSVPLRLYSTRPKRSGVRRLVSTRAVSSRQLGYLQGRALGRRPSKAVMMRSNRGDDQIEEVTEHPLIDLLHEVNPWMDGYGLSLYRFTMLQLTGNAYLHPVIGASGLPEQLWPMPSQYVEIVPDRDDFVSGYVYGRPPNETVFAVDEVLHSKIPDPMDLHYGRGWVHAAVRAIDLLSSMTEYELALFDNMARPDWGIFIAQSLTNEQWERINRQVDQRLRGKRKTGRPYVFEGGADAKPLQFSPRDLAFDKGEERMVEQVAAIAGVPVSKLLANDPNLSNAELGDYSWMKDTIAPYLAMDEEFLNQMLVARYDRWGDGLFLAYDDPVPQDQERSSRIDVAEVGAGLRLINEARADRGLDPVDGGDELRINGTSIERLDAPPPPPLPPTRVQEGDEEPEAEVEQDAPEGAGRRSARAVQSVSCCAPAPSGAVRSVLELWAHARVKAGTPDPPESILDLMAAVFRRQLAEVISDPLRWREIIQADVWVRDFAEAARPWIEQNISIGGAEGDITAVGFDVTNPLVQDFVEQHTMRVATAVNGTTVHRLESVLGDGLNRGETIPDLMARVEEWGGEGVTRQRAEVIARTESARAYVAGQELAWDQSGIVVSKRWLLAPSPCEFCRAAAAIFNGRPRPLLGEPAFPRGTLLVGAAGGRMRLDYDDVGGPPLHPQCRCDLVPVLEGEEP